MQVKRTASFSLETLEHLVDISLLKYICDLQKFKFVSQARKNVLYIIITDATTNWIHQIQSL